MGTMPIKVSYLACDGYKKTRSFRTLKGARAFAENWVGKSPDFGSFYAVSSDGVGRVTVSGVTLRELFGQPIDEAKILAEVAAEQAEEYRVECERYRAEMTQWLPDCDMPW